MSDLISRSALAEEIKSLRVTVTGFVGGKIPPSIYEKEYRETVLRIIDEQPDAERHGYWECAIGYDPNKAFQCSNCFKMNFQNDAFCPHCGAKMDEEVQNDG